MISGIHHTGIVVEHLQPTQSFYCDLLGLKELGRIESVAPQGGNHTGIAGASRTLVFLGMDGSDQSCHQIELVFYHDPPASKGHLGKHQFGASHVCFLVEDLQAEYLRLSEAGVQFETPPFFSDTKNGRLGVIYARDPEGNWIELIQGVVTLD